MLWFRLVSAADDPDRRQSFVLQQQQLAALATIAERVLLRVTSASDQAVIL